MPYIRKFSLHIPPFRKADYNLNWMEGCVFIDFIVNAQGRIQLVRISFDGYGCCELREPVLPMDEQDSTAFKLLMEVEPLDQLWVTELVRKALRKNKMKIWRDALHKYGLLEEHE